MGKNDEKKFNPTEEFRKMSGENPIVVMEQKLNEAYTFIDQLGKKQLSLDITLSQLINTLQESEQVDIEKLKTEITRIQEEVQQKIKQQMSENRSKTIITPEGTENVS